MKKIQRMCVCMCVAYFWEADSFLLNLIDLFTKIVSKVTLEVVQRLKAKS